MRGLRLLSLLLLLILSLTLTPKYHSFAAVVQGFEFKSEVVHDLSSLKLEIHVLAFVPAIPFDDSVRSLVPKTVVSELFEELDVSGFTALCLLTAVIVYPFDPYVSFTILETFSVTLAMTALTKFLVGRARPYTEEGILSFSPFSLSSRYQPFLQHMYTCRGRYSRPLPNGLALSGMHSQCCSAFKG